jgi:hypothetical protein
LRSPFSVPPRFHRFLHRAFLGVFLHVAVCDSWAVYVLTLAAAFDAFVVISFLLSGVRRLARFLLLCPFPRNTWIADRFPAGSHCAQKIYRHSRLIPWPLRWFYLQSFCFFTLTPLDLQSQAAPPGHRKGRHPELCGFPLSPDCLLRPAARRRQSQREKVYGQVVPMKGSAPSA